MKHLWIILAIMFVSLSVWADKNVIPLHTQMTGNNNDDERIRDDRSLSTPLTATLEGNVLCIYTDKTLENARITVADAQGNVWFDAEESSLSGSYSFTLDGSPQGMLILRIETKEVCYIGEFSL